FGLMRCNETRARGRRLRQARWRQRAHLVRFRVRAAGMPSTWQARPQRRPPSLACVRVTLWRLAKPRECRKYSYNQDMPPRDATAWLTKQSTANLSLPVSREILRYCSEPRAYSLLISLYHQWLTAISRHSQSREKMSRLAGKSREKLKPL